MAQARFAYEEFASYHPRHEALDYVTYRIGLSIYRDAPVFAGRDQTTTRGAVNVWTGFESRFPDSEYVDEVRTLSRAERATSPTTASQPPPAPRVRAAPCRS